MATSLTVESLEEAALRLRPDARAQLVHNLIASLGGLSQEVREHLWLSEAERRDAEMESGRIEGIAGDDVFAKIRSRFEG